jgi:hypothetical protein
LRDNAFTKEERARASTQGRTGTKGKVRRGGQRDWESLVVDLYRIDDQIPGTVHGNLGAHGDQLGEILGQEKEFTICCAC